MATLEELMALIEKMNANRPKYEYTEIKKLDKLLTEANIPHYFLAEDDENRYQIAYYGPSGRPIPKPGTVMGIGIEAVCSAIQNAGSYGNEKDLIEICGLLTDEELEEDSVKGYLTAEDVFNRIKEHWDASNK